MKTGVLLLNLGTPDSPSTADVRKYLRQFLNDPEVIDINPIGRWLLVNGIIVPFRGPKSAKLYKEIWTEKGSPLLIYCIELRDKLRKELGENYVVELGMRYQNPSIEAALKSLKGSGVNRIIALPLYPQYASSTTTSTIQEIRLQEKKIGGLPPIEIIERFYDHPAYVEAVLSTGREFPHEQYDHVLFSFHGVPERHITKTDKKLGDGKCSFGACCETDRPGNRYCYRANCVQTAHAIAKGLNIPKDKYTISFQSRLGSTPWVQPYSDKVIEEKAKSGVKKLLVFSPAFVADCLETIHEIAVEYDELFREHGGEKVQLVPSLNSREEWVKAVAKIIGQ